jgi:thioredoxin-related protein
VKILRHVVRTLLLSGLVAGTAMAADGPWVTDWEAAKAQAAKEDKTLLIDFSGSDWCGWCIKLDKEVFSQDVFQAAAKDKYVMVLLDYPRDKSGQSDELKAQNKKLQQEFKVRGYPSVFLATADGAPFAKTGYQAGGPEAYLKHLDGFMAKHAALAKLEASLPAAKGLARAKILDELYAKMTMDTPKKAAYAAEILTLDPDNKAGLKSKYLAKEIVREARGLLQQRKPEEAKAACDKALALAGLPADGRQEVLFVKSEVLFRSGDKKGAKAMLTEAAKLAPATDMAKQIIEILGKPFFKDVE